eukprot:4978459-Prymnesium_polylepis.1
MPRGQRNAPQQEALQRQREMLDQVFAALRPPDDAPLAEENAAAAAAAAAAEGVQFHQALTLSSLCTTPDYVDVLASHIVSRADVARLGCTNHTINAAVRRAPFNYLGLFRTPFGLEQGCRLEPHQERSLRHMLAAEAPPNWRFGELRGGILGDDPGLGKTVTMLALI